MTPQAAPANETASESEETPLRKQAAGFRVGMIEAGIILGSVNLLFAFFVMIQFTYLFGGQAQIAEGLTYAQYARRGFFELVAVAVLVLTLGLVLDAYTARRTKGENQGFRFLLVVLVSLTLVMLASAWQRMNLYEAAYGMTHLRVYVRLFMLAIVGLLGFFLADVFRVRRNIFAFGVLLVVIGYMAVLNFYNVEGTIAHHNIERYAAGEDLDVCYLRMFSADAVPAMLKLYTLAQAKGDIEISNHVAYWLRNQASDLQKKFMEGIALERWNLADITAWDLLENQPRDAKRVWQAAPYNSCYGSDLLR